MTRHIPLVTIALCVAATALLAGCQRPMGSATGPYAPAGSLSPASSQPLIPFGSFNGATRVPPPPTGSSQVSAGYDGQPAAMFSASPSHSSLTGLATHNPATGGQLQSSASGARSSLGGMPVIDLTAGMMNTRPPAAIYDPAAQPGGEAIGSGVAGGNGVATAGWQTTPNISVSPADLASRLRPLEPSQAVTLVPLATSQDYLPMADAPGVAMTQYRTEAGASPAWQAVQPASGQFPLSGNAFEQRADTGAYSAQLPGPSSPSTEPVQAGLRGTTGNDTLLWRNPAVAR